MRPSKNANIRKLSTFKMAERQAKKLSIVDVLASDDDFLDSDSISDEFSNNESSVEDAIDRRWPSV